MNDNNMSPYWRPDEEQRLKDLLGAGTPLEEIALFLGRSVDAVILKAKRLALQIPEKCRAKNRDLKVTKSEATTTTRAGPLPAIKPVSELASLEEMMKTLLGALQQLQNPNLSQLEIKRFRSIVSGARTYAGMLDKYQQWTRIEQKMVDMTAHMLEVQRQNLLRAKDPAEKARIEEEIKRLEESLRDLSKDYKPFQKKPNLISPVN